MVWNTLHDKLAKKNSELKVESIAELIHPQGKNGEKLKKSGSGISDLYIPKLWCFEQLSFLDLHTANRQSLNNAEENNDKLVFW